MYADNYIKNYDAVIQHMLKCYPEEGAGVVTKSGMFIPIENIAEDKLHSFQIDPTVMETYDVRAILHSHVYDPHDIEANRMMVDPRIPSLADLAGQIETDVEWGICICEGQNVTDPIWFGDYDHRPPLMDREFIHSIQDCLEFMKDWQYKEYGLKLPSQPRNFDWFEKGQNFFEDCYEAWGFVDVSDQPQARGDVVFYKIRGPVTNHIGVIVEPELVAHHLFGRFPVVEPLAVWKKYITKRIRHKTNPAFKPEV